MTGLWTFLGDVAGPLLAWLAFVGAVVAVLSDRARDRRSTGDLEGTSPSAFTMHLSAARASSTWELRGRERRLAERVNAGGAGRPAIVEYAAVRCVLRERGVKLRPAER